MKRFLSLSAALICLLQAGCALDESARKQSAYHYQMGLSYLGEKDPTRALREFTEAEKITPDDPALLNSLGQTYYYKKRFDLAEQKYLRAIELKPDYSEARNNLGVNYLEMQRWDDAASQFKLAIADLLFLNQEDAKINLGLAYLGKGDYAQAHSILSQSVVQNPRNPFLRVLLGRTYFAMDKIDLAIQEFKKAVELNRDYQSGHYYLALAYLKSKDYVAAADAFREAIKIAPDSEKGRLSREYLESMK